MTQNATTPPDGATTHARVVRLPGCAKRRRRSGRLNRHAPPANVVLLQPPQPVPVVTVAALTPELAILRHVVGVLDRRDRAEGRGSGIMCELLQGMVQDDDLASSDPTARCAVNTAAAWWDRLAAEAALRRGEG